MGRIAKFYIVDLFNLKKKKIMWGWWELEPRGNYKNM